MIPVGVGRGLLGHSCAAFLITLIIFLHGTWQSALALRTRLTFLKSLYRQINVAC
jgi:hypothetical protein